MICDQTDRNIIRFLRPVSLVGDRTDGITDRLHGIDIKYRIHILHHYRQPLQPHTGIDVLLLKLFVIALAVPVKLGEDVVPYLHIPVTVTAHATGRLAAAVLLAPVIIYFRTRSTWACPMLPEIVAGSRLGIPVKPLDPVCIDTDLIMPDRKRLFILTINGRIQTIRRQSQHIRQILPCPMDRLFLEIIAKGEVAEHLKKGQMPGCLADIIDIPCTNTFLAGAHPPFRRYLLTGEIGLQRRHSRVDQKQTVIIVRHQRKTRHGQVFLALKKF